MRGTGGGRIIPRGPDATGGGMATPLWGPRIAAAVYCKRTPLKYWISCKKFVWIVDKPYLCRPPTSALGLPATSGNNHEHSPCVYDPSSESYAQTAATVKFKFQMGDEKLDNTWCSDQTKTGINLQNRALNTCHSSHNSIWKGSRTFIKTLRK